MPRLGIGEKKVATISESSSRDSDNMTTVRYCDRHKNGPASAPLPTTHNRILPAQYSWLHHSTSRRRVSLPTTPPSPSSSLLAELTEGAGDVARESLGVAVRLPSALFMAALLFSKPFAFSSLPTFDKLSLLPEPNLRHGCPSLLRCLLTWKIRQTSLWWFFLCSESTALSSRTVHEGVNRGEWKKLEKRSSAPPSADVETLK